uniref:Uncharacterized protein n=1 Tax=Nelumbo nucifera TaxID=4432 RepID=A0A822ZR30_NELNU|nr:TPA_asm: hypothetical protein HUJ06_018361 [Nelumbo nucifera]
MRSKEPDCRKRKRTNGEGGKQGVSPVEESRHRGELGRFC